MELKEFLHILYKDVGDCYIGVPHIDNGRVVTEWFHSSNLDAMADYIVVTGTSYNTYYCVNPRKKMLPTYMRGGAEEVQCVICAYSDFDVKSPAHKQKALPETKEELIAFICNELPHKPSFLIWSGNGIHALWLFKVPCEIEGNSSYISNVLKGWEAFVKNKARESHGWEFDSVADIPRMLRAPGTTNFKTEEKPICEILEYNSIRYKVEDFEKYMQETSSKRISGHCDIEDDFACMGTGSAEEMIGKCAFLQHCKNNASELSEPLWHAAISNVALTSDGREKCHEISCPYPGYTYSETDKKYLNAVKEDKPITCEYIKNVLGFKCGCECGVKAPIALIRDGVKPKMDWEQPLSFDSFVVPEFPAETLPAPIRDFVEALAESTQTPVDMAACASIAIMSVCLQGKYKIRAKADWSEPLNTFVLNVMEPSERKSAVQNAMVKPINLYELEQNAAKAVEIEKSKTRKQILEQRQKALISQAVKGKVDMEEVDKVSEELATFKEEKPLKLYVDDITTEKLTSVLADNDGKTAVLSTEGGIFDTLAGIYTKNVNIDVILKGYSGDSIRVDRIGRQSESILCPALTMLLMAQPSVLSGLMSNGTFRGRGLTARFLYCIPTSKVGKRKYRSSCVPGDVSAEYERCILNLLEDEYEKEPEIITLSPEADILIENFAEELEPLLKTEYADITDWAGKLVGNILRISGLLCRASIYRCHDFLANNDALVVSEEIMQNAIRIGKYFIEHARAAFSLMGADNTVKQSKYVLEAIKSAGLLECTRRDVMRLCRSFKKAEEVQPILEYLCDYGYLAVKDMGAYTGKGRPPAIVYVVNPYIFNNE